jgi:hypothetical protein
MPCQCHVHEMTSQPLSTDLVQFSFNFLSILSAGCVI